MMNFNFQPITIEDIPLLFKWVHQPEIAAWYHETNNWTDFEKKFKAKINSDNCFGYIVLADNTPIGYMQYYIANKVCDGWWPNAKEGTVGIDQFIGNLDYLGKGYGSAFIKEFINTILLSQSWVDKIIVDVDPENKRALRCYQKVGFNEVGIIDTPDGKALLMEIDKDKYLSGSN